MLVNIISTNWHKKIQQEEIMKDLISFCIFIYSIQIFMKTNDIVALCLFTFLLIVYTIKYLRIKYQLANVSESNAQSLNRQKDFFINTLTHDFKVPIIAQMRGLELLKNGIMGNINEDQKEILTQIDGSCKYVLDMISMCSNAYMFEKNTYKLVYEKFNMNELITSCLEEIAAKAKEKNLTFAFFSSSNNTQIKADKNEIKKVILNLLINAINYSSNSDTINIYLSTEKNHMNFTMSGMGLVYGKNSNTKENNKYTTIGHTLGIYLSKKIIETHNGKIYLTGDNMNSFKFSLPLGLNDKTFA